MEINADPSSEERAKEHEDIYPFKTADGGCLEFC